MEAQHRLQQIERREKASPHVIGRWAGNIPSSPLLDSSTPFTANLRADSQAADA